MMGLVYANQKWPAGEYGICRICGAKGKWGAARVCPACLPTWAAWPKCQRDIWRILEDRQGIRDGFGVIRSTQCGQCQGIERFGYATIHLKPGKTSPVASIDDLQLVCSRCTAGERAANAARCKAAAKAKAQAAKEAEWEARIAAWNERQKSKEGKE